MGRAADALEVSAGQREVLDALARSQTLPFRVVTRARVLLLAADGLSNVEIAEVAGVSRPTVLAWRADFAERGLVDLGGEDRRGGRSDPAQQAGGAYALELPHDGRRDWYLLGHGAADLVRARAAAPPGRHVQAVQRQAVRGEAC